MKKAILVQAVLAALLAAACVTVNIYFPAAEVKQDAERVVQDVYGVEQPKSAPADKGRSLLDLLGPGPALAQDFKTLSNAATRGVEAELKANQSQLAPFLDSGNVGIDRDGLAALRDQAGLSLAQVAAVKRLVAKDSALKAQLYQEKARAANVPEHAAKVRDVYRGVWRDFAAPGWWVQDDSGSWRRK